MSSDLPESRLAIAFDFNKYIDRLLIFKYSLFYQKLIIFSSCVVLSRSICLEPVGEPILQLSVYYLIHK